MGDVDEQQLEPAKVALALSVILAVAALVLVLVAVTALTDWRWSTLLTGFALAYFAYVASTKAAKP